MHAAAQVGCMQDGKLTIDLSPLGDAIRTIASAMSDAMERLNRLAGPVPWREAVELRDLAQDHNLDTVERGPARVERSGGALVVTWNVEELTTYSEYTDE